MEWVGSEVKGWSKKKQKSPRKALFRTCFEASLDKTNDFKWDFRCLIKPLQQIFISSFHAEENEYCSNFDQVHMVWSH